MTRMTSACRCTDGLFRISAVDRSLFAVGQHHRIQRPSCSVSRKGRSWDYPFPAVYCRPDWSSWDTLVAAASLRRWHADCWLPSSAMRRCTDRSRVSACIWMRSNRPHLNMAKIDVLCCSSSRRQQQIPDERLRVASDLVRPVCSKSEYPSWLRSVDEHSHYTNCFPLFCCSALYVI